MKIAFGERSGDAGGVKERAMQLTKVAVLCFALAAASVLAGASLAGAEEGEGESLVGCHENVICVYTSTNYNNPYWDMFCSASGAWKAGATLQSATNRCGNKTNWLRTNGSVVACMNPGGNRPSPGNFNELFVAAEYGAFC